MVTACSSESGPEAKDAGAFNDPRSQYEGIDNSKYEGVSTPVIYGKNRSPAFE